MNNKSYEIHVSEFAKEIADEVIRRENDSSYKPILDKYSIAKSISIAHGEDLRRATEDLEKEITKWVRRLRNPD